MPSRISRRLPRAHAGHRGVHPRPGLAAVAAGAGLLAAAPAAAAQAPSSLLRQGSAGPNVAHVQRASHLRALSDGIVGPRTWDTLFRIRARSSSSPAGTSSPSAASTTSGYSIPSGIVQCESGGNYSAVNPSSGAGGAYQILPSTWAAYGGQGLPQDAPKAEQDRIAGEIYAHQGPSAWTC
jgi:hypothetical protein